MDFAFLSTTADPNQAGGIGVMLLQLSPILLIFVLMYFMMIRPQKKKEKQAAEMRNKIEVGDGITTIGGIVGRVASIKEDTFILETGSDRIKLRFKRWAIQEVEKLNLDSDNQTAGEAK